MSYQPKPFKSEIRKCVWCQKVFTWSSKKPSQKYCSNECCRKGTEFRALGSVWSLFNRDGFSCIYCGSSPLKGDNCRLVPDHINPVVAGGSDVASNLVTSCDRCNTSKNKRRLKKVIYEELTEILRRRNTEFGWNEDKLIKIASSSQIRTPIQNFP